MTLQLAKRIQQAAKPGGVTVTFTWGRVNPPAGFVSAWDGARNDLGHGEFDALGRGEQIQAVRDYVNR